MNNPFQLSALKFEEFMAPEPNCTDIKPMLYLTKHLRASVDRRHSSFYIVGGAARDTYHGRPFKDVDIAALGEADPNNIVEILKRAGAVYLDIVGHEYEGGEVQWVIKGEYENTKFDVVKYQHSHTLEQVVDRFDLNLNTWWISLDGEVQCRNGTPKERGDPVCIINPHQGMNAKMKQRILKFHQKYPHYDWEFDNRIVGVLLEHNVVRPQR